MAATFYPLNSPRANRTTELAKEFSRQGHQVTVVTPFNKQYHPAFEQQHQITIKHLGNKKYQPLSTQGGKLKNIFSRIVNRVLNILFEYPDIEFIGMVKKALKNESGYNMLVSIAVPHPIHWGVAAAISKNKNLATVWVADCGDPYMLNRLDSFNKLFYFKYFEQKFCKKANFITVPTQNSLAGYYPQYHYKIKVIPQGFNFDDTPIYTGTVKNPVPTFAYAGTFIQGSRDPTELLSFLCTQSKPFKFIIYTADVALVQPFLQASNNQVEIKPYIPRKDLIYTLSTMDFVVNFTNGTPIVTPSKLIDYAITQRPILSVDTGNLQTEIVQQFLQADYSNQFVISNIEKYKINNVASAFINLM